MYNSTPKPASQWTRLGDYYAGQRAQQAEVDQLVAEVAELEGSAPSTVRARWNDLALAETVQAGSNTGGEWHHAQRASKHLVTVAQREAERARGAGQKGA